MKKKIIIYLLFCSLLLCSCSSDTAIPESTIEPTTSQEDSGMSPIIPFYRIEAVEEVTKSYEILTTSMLEGKARIDLYLDVEKASDIRYLTFEYTPNYESVEPEDELIISDRTEKIEITSEDLNSDEYLMRKIVSFYLEKPKHNDSKDDFGGYVDIAISPYSEDGEIISKYDKKEAEHIYIHYSLKGGVLTYMMID